MRVHLWYNIDDYDCFVLHEIQYCVYFVKMRSVLLNSNVAYIDIGMIPLCDWLLLDPIPDSHVLCFVWTEHIKIRAA